MLIPSGDCTRMYIYIYIYIYARAYTTRDKQRQCIASAVRKIFAAVAPFSSPYRYLLLQQPGRSAIERRIRQEVKSESYFPGRFFLVSFLLSPSPPPGLFSIFFFSFLSFFPLSLISHLAPLPALFARRQNHASKL